MRITAINGSPNKEGNTWHALKVMESVFNKDKIEFEIIHIGNKSVRGCTACGKCREKRDEKCTITNDPVNEAIQKMKNSDGIIIAAPVFYSGIPGTMKSFLDRAFYVAGSNGGLFRHKIGSAFVTLRRTGGSATLDSMYHYLAYSEMLVATSNYWNVIHGRLPGEVIRDDEGMQIIEVLANNMTWLLKMREQTRETLEEPKSVQKIMTSFIK
jgi:multimeric flavodoxin WrbA